MYHKRLCRGGWQLFRESDSSGLTSRRLDVSRPGGHWPALVRKGGESGQYLADHVPMYVGQPVVATLETECQREYEKSTSQLAAWLEANVPQSLMVLRLAPATANQEPSGASIAS